MNILGVSKGVLEIIIKNRVKYHETKEPNTKGGKQPNLIKWEADWLNIVRMHQG